MTEAEQIILTLYHHGKGRHHHSRCPCCGERRWAWSSKEKPPRVSIGWDDDRDECERCAEVERRSPEIFEWVMNVVNTQIERHEEAQNQHKIGTPDSDDGVTSTPDE